VICAILYFSQYIPMIANCAFIIDKSTPYLPKYSAPRHSMLFEVTEELVDVPVGVRNMLS
jgi:5-methylcytosine-specific restriction endonuclease McrBC regulatory subunit McrC